MQDTEASGALHAAPEDDKRAGPGSPVHAEALGACAAPTATSTTAPAATPTTAPITTSVPAPRLDHAPRRPAALAEPSLARVPGRAASAAFATAFAAALAACGGGGGGEGGGSDPVSPAPGPRRP